MSDGGSSSSPSERPSLPNPQLPSSEPRSRPASTATRPLSQRNQQAPPPAPAQQPLHLTIRFSASLPDLELDILTPDQTTVVSLKHLIRSRLPASNNNASRRLRFIHSGKILPDNAVLSSVLKALPPPPRADRGSASPSSRPDPHGKGKHVEGRLPSAAALQRIYVNCSIGDVLSDDELEAEARAAAAPVPPQQPRTGVPLPLSSVGATGPSAQRAIPSTRGALSGHVAGTISATSGMRTSAADGASAATQGVPALGGYDGRSSTANATSTPRGFDRLLAAGFTPAEVNQLRLQFRSIQASRHTPDTMPSPDTLRSMEDAWIDNNNDAGTGIRGGIGEDGSGGGTGTAADGGDDGFGVAGLVDVLIKGMMIGFFFPLGSIGWLIREEGLWSSRWQVFVSFGFILSLTIGMIRAISSDR
ncbi:hypothetical protein VTK73DRAFT_4151 [Phialemonium thermophilum]|uniref:Ubiquitin-like domain-containing protein n=1 Tax=Phialemonium thermophilum TaxID=223376 RepID=A0ABR3XZE6_9PEZI